MVKNSEGGKPAALKRRLKRLCMVGKRATEEKGT